MRKISCRLAGTLFALLLTSGIAAAQSKIGVGLADAVLAVFSQSSPDVAKPIST